MNFKEFNKWKKDLYTPPQVNEAGDISDDKVLKFELSYGDTEEIKKMPIMAITLAEALYRSIYTVFIETCPSEMEIAGATDENDIIEIRKNLISKLTFADVKISEITETSISFIINDITYTITSEYYDFKEVYDIKIDDDLIAIWTKPNDADMICYVCYNMTNLAINLREVNKVNDLMQLNGLVKNNLFTHSNFLVCQFGFASITDEDASNEKYSNSFAKEVSYKRALLDKLVLDKKIITEQAIGLKHDFSLINATIKRYERMSRKMSKRIHDLRRFVNDKISELYPDNE